MIGGMARSKRLFLDLLGKAAVPGDHRLTVTMHKSLDREENDLNANGNYGTKANESEQKFSKDLRK